ncbi:MAG: cell wall-binding repeat-containing protein [Candidatus Hydrothermarchaeales archaeon]
MFEKLTSFLESFIKGFENRLFKKEELDVYEEAANYLLEHRPGFTDLVITRGDLHVDSLAVTPFAKLIGAPILLVRPDEIPSADYKVLEKMGGRGRIYIIGGTEAVSESVEEELKQYASKVVRIGGATRYETSVEIAKQLLLLADSPLAISVSGKEPVLYAATLAGKYRAPIVYLDRPPIKESTFKEHSVIEGTLQIQSFDSPSLQVLSDKHPVASMKFALSNPDIIDAWMYVRMRGYDTQPEKWIVRLNGKALAYNTHTEPVATYGTGQFVRFDVGELLVKDGENTLIIEGTGFNVDDEFYLTGVTLVTAVRDQSKKTEYWIKEGLDAASYEDPEFGTAKNSKLYAMYLKSSETSSLYFNGEKIHPTTKTGNFFTLMETEVISKISKENSFESKSSIVESTSPISILTVEADDLQVSVEEPEEKLDPHQEKVKNYISEKFDLIGLMYYQETIEG